MKKAKQRTPPSAGVSRRESSLGFPVGMVARSIRQIISPRMSTHHVECMAVVLVSHLMIEDRINKLIFKWLTKSLPIMSGTKKKGIAVNDAAKDEIYRNIAKLDFIKKLEFITPLGILLWGDDAKANFADIYNINNARKEVAHRLSIDKIKFRNKSLATEAGVEQFLEISQQKLLHISDLIELVEV